MGAGEYISNAGLRAYRDYRLCSGRVMASLHVVCEDGRQVALTEIVEKSVSNPAIRKAEMLARVSGLEKVARSRGDVGLFVTLTCPSEFHRMTTAGSQVARNGRWAGHDPRAGQRWLSGCWARLRAAAARRGIEMYGLRVTEPHKDGTPHWHMILWVTPSRRDEWVGLLMRYFGAGCGSGSSAGDGVRVKVVELDAGKGSAVSYVHKYVSKGLDGDVGRVGAAPAGETAKSERVVAWSRIWGIRQFQFTGGPPVSVWRECRRVRRISDCRSESLRAVVVAADRGDYAAFVDAMGGVCRRRREWAVGLLMEGGERRRVIGVECRVTGEIVLTRIHRWWLQYGRSDLDNCVITVRAVFSTVWDPGRRGGRKSGESGPRVDLSSGNSARSPGLAEGVCANWAS